MLITVCCNTMYLLPSVYPKIYQFTGHDTFGKYGVDRGIPTEWINVGLMYDYKHDKAFELMDIFPEIVTWTWEMCLRLTPHILSRLSTQMSRASRWTLMMATVQHGGTSCWHSKIST